ncbi:MAG TPA: hypothetical protein P5567_05575 [Kiritimatiellia bacterium]|nr:hypothetical protein [Kiritimatiellia bacterium]HRZ11908.1 hypothetical protein [Kiritimatiellia bacterium]HSA17286.1 hypothetical protein [Kiritimatiellia bacterium]
MKTQFERRMKELERESRRVRADLRTLTKALDKPERLATVPRPQSLVARERPVAPPRREDPVTSPEEAAPPSGGAVADAPPPGELFAWRSPAAARPASPRAPEPAAPRAGRMVEPTRKAGHLLKDDRFANYFASGSFVGAPPVKGEGRVQRNKAVFMIFIVVIVGFVLYSLIF